jgi:hypothetical protein
MFAQFCAFEKGLTDMTQIKLLMQLAKEGKNINQYEPAEASMRMVVPSLYIHKSTKATKHVLVTIEDEVK